MCASARDRVLPNSVAPGMPGAVQLQQHNRNKRNAGGMVELVQLLLPVYDNDGTPFPATLYAEVRRELTDRFGGVTAWVRAPASGTWKEDDGDVVRDDIVVYEVMVEAVDEGWWRDCRERLRRRFRQEELVVRAWPVRLI